MRIAVFDTDANVQNELRGMLAEYAVDKGLACDLLIFSALNPLNSIAKYAASIQLSFISLADVAGLEKGQCLYRHNPGCRICYYGSQDDFSKNLLCTRPMGFYNRAEGKEHFFELLKTILLDIDRDNQEIVIDKRSAAYRFMAKDILYLNSDLRYVIIHTINGNESKIYKRLSDVEKLLPQRFIRIHKSYIVNRDYIQYVDKRSHNIKLCNGSELPVSSAQYASVLKKIFPS